MSLPYSEPGIRLIRQDRVEDFAAKMQEFQEELIEAVEILAVQPRLLVDQFLRRAHVEPLPAE